MHISETQTFDFSENAYFLSPYKVLRQSLDIQIQRNKVSSYSQVSLVKQTESSLVLGPYKDVEPFKFELFVVSFRHTDPQVILTQATRSI